MKIALAAIAVCGAVAIYNLVCLMASRREESSVKDRVYKLAKNRAINDVRGAVLREKKEKRKNILGLKLVSQKLEQELNSAGMKLTGEEFLTMWMALTFLPAIVLLLLSVSVITIIAVFVIGLMAPFLIVEATKKKRMQLFDKQLGEALMVMSNSMRAGYTFPQAMDSIAKESQPPLSDEFKIVLSEIDMGASMEDALKHMVDRTKNDDVKILVSAVLIASQVGANLADVLDSISDTIRGRIEMKEQIKVLTAQGRLSGWVVGGIPIFLVGALMILNPEYIGGFIESPIGILMLCAGMFMEIIGFIVISKIVDIKY